jgi:hypothetical protein
VHDDFVLAGAPVPDGDQLVVVGAYQCLVESPLIPADAEVVLNDYGRSASTTYKRRPFLPGTVCTGSNLNVSVLSSMTARTNRPERHRS